MYARIPFPLLKKNLPASPKLNLDHLTDFSNRQLQVD